MKKLMLGGWDWPKTFLPTCFLQMGNWQFDGKKVVFLKTVACKIKTINCFFLADNWKKKKKRFLDSQQNFKILEQKLPLSNQLPMCLSLLTPGIAPQ